MVPTTFVEVEVTTGILIKLEQNDEALGYKCRALTIAFTSLHTLAGGRAGFGRAETAVQARAKRRKDRILRSRLFVDGEILVQTVVEERAKYSQRMELSH